MTKGGHGTVPVKCRLAGKRGKNMHSTQEAQQGAQHPQTISFIWDILSRKRLRQSKATELFHLIEVRQ